MSEVRPPCAGLWNTPMVHVDGDVTVCCLDEHLENRIGNLRETPLAKLWNGDLINRWRAAHVEGALRGQRPPLHPVQLAERRGGASGPCRAVDRAQRQQ